MQPTNLQWSILLIISTTMVVWLIRAAIAVRNESHKQEQDYPKAY